MNDSHINVTIDLSTHGIEGTYDLRIPRQISVKQLVADILEVLKLQQIDGPPTTLKVITKNLVLSDDDQLVQYPVTDGDILTVL